MTKSNDHRNKYYRLLEKHQIHFLNWVFLSVTFITLFLSVFFIINTWNANVKEIDDHAKRHAISVEAAFQKSVLSELKADAGDLDRPEYQEIKSSLMRIVQEDSWIRFAYVYVERDQKIYFVADSEPADSPDYSPPGQEYYEADEATFKPLLDGETIITEPGADRWGTWVSVLVPMISAETGKTTAVFGVDYPADSFYSGAVSQTVKTGVIALSIIILLLVLYVLFRQYILLLIEKKKQIELNNLLKESERSKSVLLDNLPGMAYRCNFDENWTMQFVSEGCTEITGYKPQSILNNNELSFNDLILPEYRESLHEEWVRALRNKESFQREYQILHSSGERRWVLEVGQGVFDEAEEVRALEGIIVDISEQKKKEEAIQYMSEHDFLTGLYNRKYFEEILIKLDTKANLPLSLLFIDINGVRLINDAFGYMEGDRLIIETAEILSQYSRPSDVAARIGGDEFAIILPNTGSGEVQTIVKKITEAGLCHNINAVEKQNYEISLSVGYATKDAEDKPIDEIVRAADEFVRSRKLLNRKSVHSSIMSYIMSTVYEKSQETEEHARRIVELARMIGEKVGITQRQQDELELLSMLHDIGKIAINDSILNKPGKLDEGEWNIMKKHPEIGYRIAKATSELEPIAEYILCHHERWDGKGYPNGLAGEEIPLLSRILAVADAYDAMTEDRVYRKALTREQAVDEIRRNSGIQFDPDIVSVFCKVSVNKSE